MTTSPTVRSVWNMRCPSCGDDSQLDIAATVSVRLTPEGSDTDGTFDGSHEWDSGSPVQCITCGWSGLVKDTETDRPPLIIYQEGG